MKNKVAVITGAGGTLCSEMARGLAKKGYSIALLGRTLSKLQDVEKELIDSGAKAVSVECDVASFVSITSAHALVNENLGPCDVLINGAGGNQMDAITTINSFLPDELEESTETKGFFNLSMESFQSVLITNTMGSVMPCQVFGEDMAKNGGGCIINIASMNSYRPLSRVAAYGMAKAGVKNFTQWLAAYLAPANIRVNAIAPGFFLNEKNRYRLLDKETGNCTQRGEQILSHTPMCRFGESNELVGCVNWLTDESASGFTTGITIPIDGGFLACSGV